MAVLVIFGFGVLEEVKTQELEEASALARKKGGIQIEHLSNVSRTLVV